MTVDEIVRAWRDPDYVETLDPEAAARIPENPAGSVAVLDREIGPTRVPPSVEGLVTCEEPCGDTCPPPLGNCNNTCFSGGQCCC